jgi:hypothetical protein
MSAVSFHVVCFLFPLFVYIRFIFFNFILLELHFFSRARCFSTPFSFSKDKFFQYSDLLFVKHKGACPFSAAAAIRPPMFFHQ